MQFSESIKCNIEMYNHKVSCFIAHQCHLRFNTNIKILRLEQDKFMGIRNKSFFVQHC